MTIGWLVECLFDEAVAVLVGEVVVPNGTRRGAADAHAAVANAAVADAAAAAAAAEGHAASGGAAEAADATAVGRGCGVTRGDHVCYCLALPRHILILVLVRKCMKEPAALSLLPPNKTDVPLFQSSSFFIFCPRNSSRSGVENKMVKVASPRSCDDDDEDFGAEKERKSGEECTYTNNIQTYQRRKTIF